MIVTNLPDLKNQEYKVLGIVEGDTVFSKHLGKDFMAGFKNMVGGELKSYTEMLIDAKKQAYERMLENAYQIGADAILNVEYSITNLQSGGALVVTAIGTGVKLD